MYDIMLGWVLKYEIPKLMDKYIFSHTHTHTHRVNFLYNKTTFYLQGYASSQLINAFRSNEIRVHK